MGPSRHLKGMRAMVSVIIVCLASGCTALIGNGKKTPERGASLETGVSEPQLYLIEGSEHLLTQLTGQSDGR